MSVDRPAGALTGRASAQPLDVEIGQAIRDARIASGLGQRELCERIKLTLDRVRDYEIGAARIPAGTLFDVCDILQLPIDRLFSKLKRN